MKALREWCGKVPGAAGWIGLLLVGGGTAWAQAPGGAGGPPGWNGALTRLFDGFDGFSSVGDWRAVDRAGKEVVRLRMGFAKLQERLRLEIDLNQMKSDQLQPQTLAVVRQLGMDRMVVVVVPSRNVMQLIYPQLQSYVEMPMPEESANNGRNLKISRSRVGEEKIDGRVCVKHKTALQGAGTERFDALEWLAPDLRNFPVQVQMQDREMTVFLRCSEVQLARPDARQFDPPPGFRKYTDVTRLMEDSARRVMTATTAAPTNRPAGGTNRSATQVLRPLVSSTNRATAPAPGRPAGTATNRTAVTNRAGVTNRTATPARPR
jgi:hypothetical protein